MIEKCVLFKILSSFLKKNYDFDRKMGKMGKWACHRSFIANGSLRGRLGVNGLIRPSYHMKFIAMDMFRQGMIYFYMRP